MKMSDSTNEIFKAFSKFQGELENAAKNSVNPGVKNKYADLAECINTAKPVLMENGLSVSQMIGMSERGEQTLITVLAHESGQWMSSEFVMVNAFLNGSAGKNPAQVLGSAITYQRRYAFAAIIGMAQQDDDGNSISSGSKASQKNIAPTLIDAGQITALKSIIEGKGYTVESALEVWSLSDLSEIQSENYNSFIEAVKSWK